MKKAPKRQQGNESKARDEAMRSMYAACMDVRQVAARFETSVDQARRRIRRAQARMMG